MSSSSLALAAAGPACAAAVAIIGQVVEDDFERARETLEEFADYCDYADYRDLRESLQAGLAMAGVDAAIVHFNLSALLSWRELTGTGGQVSPSQAVADAHDLWQAE